VPQEWLAIPGHHGDVEDETVKRPQVLCHVDLFSLLTDGKSRLGRGQVSGKIVHGMVRTMTGLHLPSWDGQ
jgi:hypothetical protein